VTKGSTVKVYPHGSPQKSAHATVLVACKTAVMLAFADKPPFAILREGIMLHPDHGIVMMVQRYEIGPWFEIFGGGHYEIEEL